MAAPGFWDDQQKANKIIAEMKSLKARLDPWQACSKELEELFGLAEITEPSDEASISHAFRYRKERFRESAASRTFTCYGVEP